VAHETATHEENIAENKYVTLGLEAAYLATGQARRAEAIRHPTAVRGAVGSLSRQQVHASPLHPSTLTPRAPLCASGPLLPRLYTFRRCPYAMRARMALLQAGQVFEAAEVSLRDKPASLLALSPKATVLRLAGINARKLPFNVKGIRAAKPFAGAKG